MARLLRTPDERFADLPDWPYAPQYITLTSEARLHYIDEGQGDPILCLHGEPTWSYLYRKMIPMLSQTGRVIAPDFIGFGRSDKYAEIDDYSFAMHFAALRELVEGLDLQRITLVCQDWGGILGLPLATTLEERFARLVIMNTGLPGGDTPITEGFMQWRAFAQNAGRDLEPGRLVALSTTTRRLPEEVRAAYDAPFPDADYRAGVAAFPLLVPIQADAPGAAEIRAAREALKDWHKPVQVMFSDGDPVTRGGDRFFRRLIPGAQGQPEITITGAGHFLQEEQGELIAEHIAAFVPKDGSSA